MGGRGGPRIVPSQRRSGGGALRTDSGGRASSQRGQTGGASRDTAPLDAGGGSVEPSAAAARTPAAAGTQSGLRRIGADGRKLPRLVRRAGAGGLLNEHGG